MVLNRQDQGYNGQIIDDIGHIDLGGFCSFREQPTNARHRHDYYEICLVTAGSGRYDYGNRSFDLAVGDVFSASPGVFHEISSFETRDLELYFVSLTARFTDPLEVHATGAECLLAFPGLIQASLRPVDLIKTFTLEMIDRLAPPRAEQDAMPSDMQLAMQFIASHLSSSITVSELADALRVSERTLLRRFRLVFGKSVQEVINQRRMIHASHQLLMGFGVGEVAERMGIEDPAQFTRMFRRVFGIPPKQFQLSYLPGSLAKQTEPLSL